MLGAVVAAIVVGFIRWQSRRGATLLAIGDGLATMLAMLLFNSLAAAVAPFLTLLAEATLALALASLVAAAVARQPERTWGWRRGR